MIPDCVSPAACPSCWWCSTEIVLFFGNEHSWFRSKSCTLSVWSQCVTDASYIDCVAQKKGSYPNMIKKPDWDGSTPEDEYYKWDGSTAKDARWRKDGTWSGTWRNSHWAEYYYMGALLAHTIVLVLDTAWVKSQYCRGELKLFLRNARNARHDDAAAAAAAGHGHEGFPGSRFQLVVIYDNSLGTVCDGVRLCEGCKARGGRGKVRGCGECEACRHDGLVHREAAGPDAPGWHHRYRYGSSHAGGHDLCHAAYGRLGEEAKADYDEVTSEEEARQLCDAATQETLRDITAMFSGEGEPVRLLAADLSGSRSKDAGSGRLRDEHGFEQLREWVHEYSAALAEAHPARDAESEADKHGYCELYDRHWKEKALDQIELETEDRAWWWRDEPFESGPKPKPAPLGGDAERGTAGKVLGVAAGAGYAMATAGVGSLGLAHTTGWITAGDAVEELLYQVWHSSGRVLRQGASARTCAAEAAKVLAAGATPFAADVVGGGAAGLGVGVFFAEAAKGGVEALVCPAVSALADSLAPPACPASALREAEPELGPSASLLALRDFLAGCAGKALCRQAGAALSSSAAALDKEHFFAGEALAYLAQCEGEHVQELAEVVKEVLRAGGQVGQAAAPSRPAAPGGFRCTPKKQKRSRKKRGRRGRK